ncbi:menaquinol-cytochrome c reductase iron-sulfur subunit precursor [Haloarcula vallismortis]|uniref:Rieske iron-sulfur protein n=2 Tax=Haloarcula vallismortis TaxID=28442 RepID=M0JQQ8_HALVA|nr:Rieske 2Fe-2S domain-containing protein [Haloarcula vallismortis]EMA10324.1 Rieske iron-sulfur protein [Haloarcula vallismortis ATCC 29715]SDW89943.1 menaquinol-cytochrome c reductase iron-sulfur subunit precursor [Haloarcula vallismortis]
MIEYPKPDDDDEEQSDDCSCDGPSGTSPTLYGDARAELRRRDFAKFLATVGGLTAVASLTAPLASTTQVFERGYNGPVYSDGIHLVDSEGERIAEGRLSEGEHITVFPEPRPGIEDAPTLLVRYAESDYGSDISEGFTVSGYAAFSKVCTHAGCMVSDREEDLVVCPCHFGKFNVLEGAAVSGGPPGRALPQLPITVTSDGFLVATGDFEGPVGPGGE